MGKAFFILLLLLLLSGCQGDEDLQPELEKKPPREHEVLFDVTLFAGKSSSELEQLLGESMVSQQPAAGGQNYPRRSYQDGAMEIVFVEDRAAWFVIHPEDALPFRKTTLEALGLPVTEPAIFHPMSFMRWRDYHGFREINFFANPDATIRYISVCDSYCP